MGQSFAILLYVERVVIKITGFSPSLGRENHIIVIIVTKVPTIIVAAIFGSVVRLFLSWLFPFSSTTVVAFPLLSLATFCSNMSKLATFPTFWLS